VVRICFALGNMTVSNDRCRAALHGAGAVPGLLAMLPQYISALREDTPAAAAAEGDRRRRSPAQVRVDAAAKIARLLANIAASRATAPVLGAAAGVDGLVAAVDAVPLDALGAAEELLLAALFAIGNALCMPSGACRLLLDDMHGLIRGTALGVVVPCFFLPFVQRCCACSCMKTPRLSPLRWALWLVWPARVPPPCAR
jgi:hypothetical protein